MRDMKTVILAGGKGTRLKPYTTVFPKPLMPIRDKPILEIVIEQLKSHGLDDIIMAVGHYAELIKAFFGDGSKHGVKITYSREDTPLGTVGALSLIMDELDSTFLMMNGDVLTDIDYSKLVENHKKSGAMVTISLKKRNVNIDFGIVEIDDENTITDYTEKPTIDYHVSMGVYVLEPEVLDYIPAGEKMDFPELMKTLISDGKKINGFIHEGYWLDIGRPEDYDKANQDIENNLK